MTTEAAPGLGAAIRRQRKAAGLSQPQLAEKLGMSVQAVSQFERGVTVPGVYTLAELAAALGVTYGVLFDEPLALAEHAIAQVRAEVRTLGFDIALIPREPTAAFHAVTDSRAGAEHAEQVHRWLRDAEASSGPLSATESAQTGAAGGTGRAEAPEGISAGSGMVTEDGRCGRCGTPVAAVEGEPRHEVDVGRGYIETLAMAYTNKPCGCVYVKAVR